MAPGDAEVCGDAIAQDMAGTASKSFPEEDQQSHEGCDANDCGFDHDPVPKANSSKFSHSGPTR